MKRLQDFMNEERDRSTGVMTPEEHADKIRILIYDLNVAIRAAARDGIRTKVIAEDYACISMPTMSQLDLNEIRVEITKSL